MNKESRQRQRFRNAAAQSSRPRGQRSRIFKWAFLFAMVAAAGALALVWNHHKNAAHLVAHSPALPGFRPPTDFASLCKLTPAEIARCDIAVMNLLCAEGLRGSEGLNVTNCLERLDNLAKYVKRETDKNLHRFHEHPDEFNHSEGYYRMMMITVLQQDTGIHYNPAHAGSPDEPIEPNQEFFADSKDVFIHGLTRDSGMGTCSSLPVFYTALGRRMGCPLKLVRAKGHLFVRWVEEGQNFNIEATSAGFVSHTDNEYRNWPFPFTAGEEQTESYLTPLTPVQELATFLGIRGQCCMADGNLLHAVGAFAQAYYKEPQSVGNQRLFAWAERKAHEAGALPKPMELQYGIQTLEIPPGPMRAQLMTKKAELEA